MGFNSAFKGLRSARHGYKRFVTERYWTYNVSKIKLQATVLLKIRCVFTGRQSDLERDEEAKFEQIYIGPMIHPWQVVLASSHYFCDDICVIPYETRGRFKRLYPSFKLCFCNNTEEINVYRWCFAIHFRFFCIFLH